MGGVRAKSRTCLECHYKRITRVQRHYERPTGTQICGAQRRKCDKCRNWIIDLGERTNSLSCADHAAWRARLLRERQMIVCAYSNKVVHQLPLDLRENSWIWRQGFRARVSPKKQARALRRKQKIQSPDIDIILEEVSDWLFPGFSIP